MDVRYAVALHSLAEKWYGELASGLIVLQVVLTASAVALIAKDYPLWASISGGLLALVSGIQQGYRPAVRAAKNAEARKKFLNLAAKMETMTILKIDVDADKISGESPVLAKPFEWIAYNDNLRSAGRYQETIDEGFRTKVVRMFIA